MEPQDQEQTCLPRDATEEEIQTLTHELDEIPISAWLLAFTGAAANLARYGVQAIWRASQFHLVFIQGHLFLIP